MKYCESKLFFFETNKLFENFVLFQTVFDATFDLSCKDLWLKTICQCYCAVVQMLEHM
jgi:hypothetical protein